MGSSGGVETKQKHSKIPQYTCHVSPRTGSFVTGSSPGNFRARTQASGANRGMRQTRPGVVQPGSAYYFNF